MIFTDLDALTAYRMHTPKWATAPTSGAGAASGGGRANRPGVQALYLASQRRCAHRPCGSASPPAAGSKPPNVGMAPRAQRRGAATRRRERPGEPVRRHPAIAAAGEGAQDAPRHWYA